MDDNNSSCLPAARNEGSVNRYRFEDLTMKELHSRGDPSQTPIASPRPTRVPQLPPAGRKLDKTSVENFRYFFHRRGTTGRDLFVVASSPGVTIFPSPVPSYLSTP